MQLRFSPRTAAADQSATHLAPGEAAPRDPLERELNEYVGDLIAATGLLSEEELTSVRLRAVESSFSDAIVAAGVAAPDGFARMLASRYQLPFVDLSTTGVATQAVSAIPQRVLERAVAVPYWLEDDRLCVAIADPENVQAIDELRLATRYQLELGVAPAEDILAELSRLSRVSSDAIATATFEAAESIDLVADAADLEAEDGVSDAPIVRLVNSVILQAAEDGASDVHFVPQADALVVRLRVDGVLHQVQRIPKRLAAGVTTRLKVLAKLDIAERRKPQDGRMSLSAATSGRMLDIRVATLPTVEGETVVLRLLDKSRKPPTLEELGLPDVMQAELTEIINRPTGALLVTGPTGSGKSTSLYAALNQINRPEINIITVEDPVEYRLLGVNQIQINVRAGVTFATALRAILRADPDVVMVGEIRDGETAKIATEAALTGHLVLSTLHTNDAPSALTRLNEMGVEPFVTGAAVSAVLAQRLARKLCVHCREIYQPTYAELIGARLSPELATVAGDIAFYRKRGCPHCGRTGYKGRIGIYQLLVMSEALEELVSRKAGHDEVERVALSEGSRTLWDDGMEKVIAGVTSVEELARVCT
jgi:type IV pilus assembly protein PilB